MLFIIAFSLDLIIGDPRSFHPVAITGKLARITESLFRKLISNDYLSGMLTSFLILFFSGAASFLLISLLFQINFYAAYAVSAFLFSFTFAVRSMLEHAKKIKSCLVKGDLSGARTETAKIVGRNTENLSPEDLIRASVESTAESLIDGIFSPILFGFIGMLLQGPALAVAFAVIYRNANTMDSMFGHKNKKYKMFGWASARLDDLLNFIPARIAFIFILISSIFRKENHKNCIKIYFRDRNKHPSPNAGQSEAAFAGALGIQLGGENEYAEGKERRPFMGDPLEKLVPRHIDRAGALLMIASLLLILVCSIPEIIVSVLIR